MRFGSSTTFKVAKKKVLRMMTPTAPAQRSTPPLIWIQDDLHLGGNTTVKMVCIVDSLPPEDLKDTIESLLEIGLSQVELMREILQVIEEILKGDGRFDALAREIGRYREIFFKEERCLPFTMIEARAIMSTVRRWMNAIERPLELPLV